jgi:hypothetical protein
MRHQIAQQGQGLGPQGDGLVSPPQAALRDIQMEGPKTERVFLCHQTSCVVTSIVFKRFKQVFKCFTHVLTPYFNTLALFLNGALSISSLHEVLMRGSDIHAILTNNCTWGSVFDAETKAVWHACLHVVLTGYGQD